MRILSFFYFFIFSFLFHQGLCTQDKLGFLNSTHLQSEMTSTRNKTYVLDPHLINTKQRTSYFIEMQLSTQDVQVEECQIVFAFSKEKPLYYNQSSQMLIADQIDKQAFYLRKKYFRITFDLEPGDESNYYFFLTVYQNQEETHSISFSILLGVEDEGGSEIKRCPFDCLGNGICDKSFGICNCKKGYFDSDCSTQAFGLDHFRNESNYFDFEWNSTIIKNQPLTYFYHKVPTSMDNQISLELHSQTQLSKGNILVLFANSISSEMQFQNQFLLSASELTNGTKLQLQIHQGRYLQQASQNISGSQLQQSEYFVGFILIDINTVDLSISLAYDKNSQQQNDSDNSGHTLIVVLFLVLLVLSILLIGLIVCLYKRNFMINQIMLQQLERKKKKEEELSEILSLIQIFTFSNDLRQSIMQQGDTEEPCCPVCLCEFEESEKIRKTYCPHYFHDNCLSSWLLKQKNCPHCRNSLTSEDLKMKVKNEIKDVKVAKPQNECNISNFSPTIPQVQQLIPLQIVNDYIQQIDDDANQYDSPACRNTYQIQGDEINNYPSTKVFQRQCSTFRRKDTISRKLSMSFTNDNEKQVNLQEQYDKILIDLKEGSPVNMITDIYNLSLGDESNKHELKNKLNTLQGQGVGVLHDSITQLRKNSHRSSNRVQSKLICSAVPRRDSIIEE